MDIADLPGITGNLFGLLAIALLGTGLAASNWLRLIMWQRFSSLVLQTVLTHGALLWAAAWLSGLTFLDLAAWDVAIFAACYISYCAYLGYARTARAAALMPSRFARMTRPEMAVELVLAFLDSAVYRAVYSWSDLMPNSNSRIR